MGYTTSTIHGIEVPDSSEANNIPEDIGKVVTALEAGSLTKRLTGAQISALTSPQKPAGLLVYNTTTGKLQISDGTSFADVGAATYAVGSAGTGQSVSNGFTDTITYSSETDPSSILASGVVTIPSAGVWIATGSLSLTADATGSVLSIKHNAGYPSYSEITRLTTVSAVVYAAASDTVEMKFQNGSGSSKSVLTAYFAVAKIGT